MKNNHTDHQDVYEWWMSRREEINNGIDTLREFSNLELEVLDIMQELLKSIKIKNRISDYLDEHD